MNEPTDKKTAPWAPRFPWPEGEKATRLLTRRMEVCTDLGDRASDLLVSFLGCGCGWLDPEVRIEELVGLGAEREEDFPRLAARAIAGRDAAPVTCPDCGASLDPRQALAQMLFTHAASRRADLVTLQQGRTLRRFLWSHTDGSLRVLDPRQGSASGKGSDLDAFLVASSFRLALGQVRFHDPQQPPALRSCLRRDPNFLPAVELTAQIRMAQGLFQDAAALFRRVVRESPGRVESWYALGLCLTESFRAAPASDKPELAEQAVRALLEAEERSLSPVAAHHRALGALLLMAGHEEAAAQQLETALDLEPDHPDAVLHLGMARLRCHRPQEARGLLERAAEDRPQDPVAALWLAESLIALGEHQEAEAQLARCRALGAPSERIDALANKLLSRGTIK